MSASTSRYTGISAWSLASARASSRVGVQSLVTLIRYNRAALWRRDGCQTLSESAPPLPFGEGVGVRGLNSLLGRLHLLFDLSRVRHRFDTVHVRHRVPVRGVLLPAARLDPELLGEHGDQDLHLHIPKAGQLLDPGGEVIPVAGLPPYRPGIASVFGDDHLAQSLCAVGHAARESVQRWPLAEHADELVRVHAGDLPHVEVA